MHIIQSASFDKKSPIRVFQALRIAVNDEFSHILDSFRQAMSLVRKGGAIAIITFHSIEDRLVKNFFKPYLEPKVDNFTGVPIEEAKWKKYSKKPIIPSDQEILQNPRSRSAKLRVYIKNS